MIQHHIIMHSTHPKQNPNKIINILLVFSIAVFLFGSGYKLGEYKTLFLRSGPQAVSGKSASSVNFSTFWEAWDKIQQKYADKTKIDPQKMLYGATKGMASSLEDPYTFFLTPEENKKSKDDLGGKFEGIGAQLGLKDNKIVIIAPLKNSPAEKAGIMAGDIITKINGESTKGLSLSDAVTKIRGEKGTKVALTVMREETEKTFEIIRGVIKIHSVELSFETKIDCAENCRKTAYLKLNQFGENTTEEWNKAINEISDVWQKKEIAGMILDLRDNPGGFLDGSVYLASEFLSEGKLVVKQESTVSQTKEYIVNRKGKLLSIPLVVLVNKGSASASEILSGALRDYKRAVIIGEKTFGKGSVQEVLDLQDGSGLHVTVAKWILPNGDWINGKGIEPDINVEHQPSEGNTLTRNNDSQLEKALEELLK